MPRGNGRADGVVRLYLGGGAQGNLPRRPGPPPGRRRQSSPERSQSASSVLWCPYNYLLSFFGLRTFLKESAAKNVMRSFASPSRPHAFLKESLAKNFVRSCASPLRPPGRLKTENRLQPAWCHFAGRTASALRSKVLVFGLKSIFSFLIRCVYVLRIPAAGRHRGRWPG